MRLIKFNTENYVDSYGAATKLKLMLDTFSHSMVLENNIITLNTLDTDNRLANLSLKDLDQLVLTSPSMWRVSEYIELAFCSNLKVQCRNKFDKFDNYRCLVLLDTSEFPMTVSNSTGDLGELVYSMMRHDDIVHHSYNKFLDFINSKFPERQRYTSDYIEALKAFNAELIDVVNRLINRLKLTVIILSPISEVVNIIPIQEYIRFQAIGEFDDGNQSFEATSADGHTYLLLSDDKVLKRNATFSRM